jgi:GT2 family glycosyltransferase
MTPKVFIIVLNWNRHEDSIECIHSIRKINYHRYEIVIVDNGSTDGSEEILRRAFPDIKLIQTGDNLGFAEGNNVGIRYALENGADYAVILNNDTTVDANFVTELVNAAESDKSIGIVSSKIYFYDRPDVLWYAGAVLDLKTGKSKHTGYNEKDAGQYDTVRETDRACGCSMMISRRACETVGLMDAGYFCYGEEADWSLRVREAGYKVVFVPASKVWHKISAATGGAGTGYYLYYSVRNHLHLVKTHLPLKPVGLNVIRDVLIVTRYIFSLFTMKISKVRGIKIIWSGMIDSYRNRFGRKDLT